MQSSSGFLDDPESVWVDDSGKSVAYFCKKNPIKVNEALISDLKQAGKRLGDNNLRLCLHENPEAVLHEMVNLEYKGKYYRPHKHYSKGESYHIIEGQMAAFVFDEQGGITDANVLDAHSNFLYRVGVEMYHAVMPLSDLIVYHETRLGPFVRDGDSVFPPWAPDGTDPDEAAKYAAELLRFLRSR